MAPLFLIDKWFWTLGHFIYLRKSFCFMDHYYSNRLLAVVTLIFFLAFGYLFRRKVPYIFCNLKKYDTSYSCGGWSGQIGAIHFIIALLFCAINFDLLYNIDFIAKLFNNTAIRIPAFLSLLVVWLLITGLLIEAYLVRTDEEYKVWKQDYLKKRPGKS